MTVKELIEQLEKEDPTRLVVMSKDSEGNGFSPGYAVEACSYVADSTWSGEIGLEELTDKLREAGYSEEDVKEDGVPALCLWPVN